MPRLPWFEDFSDHAVRPPTAAEKPDPPPAEAPDPRAEAWTEGFFAGCRAADADSMRQGQFAAAELRKRVAEIEDTLAAVADQSAATMGLLLLDVLTAALPAGWPADRLTEIVAAIRPVFALEPRLHISPAVMREVPLCDLPALLGALEGGDREFVISWRQPAAASDPVDLRGTMRQALGSEESQGPLPAKPSKAVPPSPVEG